MVTTHALPYDFAIWLESWVSIMKTKVKPNPKKKLEKKKNMRISRFSKHFLQSNIFFLYARKILFSLLLFVWAFKHRLLLFLLLLPSVFFFMHFSHFSRLEFSSLAIWFWRSTFRWSRGAAAAEGRHCDIGVVVVLNPYIKSVAGRLYNAISYKKKCISIKGKFINAPTQKSATKFHWSYHDSDMHFPNIYRRAEMCSQTLSTIS